MTKLTAVHPNSDGNVYRIVGVPDSRHRIVGVPDSPTPDSQIPRFPDSQISGARLGYPFDIDFAYVGAIARHASGKYEDCVCELTDRLGS